MKNIILNAEELIVPPPKRIVWYYSEQQPKLEVQLPNVEFRVGLPDMTEFEGSEPALLVVDDFMAECNSEITKLFTKGSHHRNLSIWFLMQKFFHKSKEIRSITLNAQYIIMFKNPRDCQQVRVLARQMFGQDAPYMEEAFEDATSQPHGYLLVDAKQATPDHVRLKTSILPSDPVYVYACLRTYKKTSIEFEAM